MAMKDFKALGDVYLASQKKGKVIDHEPAETGKTSAEADASADAEVDAPADAGARKAFADARANTSAADKAKARTDAWTDMKAQADAAPDTADTRIPPVAHAEPDAPADAGVKNPVWTMARFGTMSAKATGYWDHPTHVMFGDAAEPVTQEAPAEQPDVPAEAPTEASAGTSNPATDVGCFWTMPAYTPVVEASASVVTPEPAAPANYVAMAAEEVPDGRGDTSPSGLIQTSRFSQLMAGVKGKLAGWQQQRQERNAARAEQIARAEAAWEAAADDVQPIAPEPAPVTPAPEPARAATQDFGTAAPVADPAEEMQGPMTELEARMAPVWAAMLNAQIPPARSAL